jgi:hypothetical protein
MFDELVKEVTKELEAKENRGRARGGNVKARFEYAVRSILGELWRSTVSHPPSESLINLRAGYYSELPRYRDAKLTYRQVKAAFDGMIDCRLIEVTTRGNYRRDVGQGGLTQFVPTGRLLERFEGFEGHPAFLIKHDLDKETIILRDNLGDGPVDVDYPETPKTEEFRSNLRLINDCFIKHWADLRIKDAEIEQLSKRLELNSDKYPIDLSKRTLTRIFANGSFKEGGRFYRGWWQNVPSEYRKFITIDEGVTTEYDFSQLSPHMLYFAYNHKLGEEDAYGRVLDGEHRDVVKKAFNAMVQSSSPLNRKPTSLNMDGLDMSWGELRQRILEAHKPIKDLFFCGTGNKLQFVDSCIAESVMLHFAKQNLVALPVHDSFIMREQYAGELEEAMRRGFYNEFQADIPLKREVIIERVAQFDDQGTPLTGAVTRDDREHSQWFDRNTQWLKYRGDH